MRTGQVTGEQLRIAIVKRGENPHQGVGFLEDGTMVVIDHGAGKIGLTVETVVTNTVQTSAGRLIFARLAEPSSDDVTQAAPSEAAAESSEPPAADARISTMARAATTQPRTPPRPGRNPRR
jgi:hypothetical protein